MNPSLFVLFLLVAASVATAQPHDLVLRGGRVMDPESGLDAVRQVGITGGEIRAISTGELEGRETLDVSGLVVAPGFIDLHQHAWDAESVAAKALDGVTSILELEVGTNDIEKWFGEREGVMPIHYGVSIGHIQVRMKVMKDFPGFLPPAGSNAATRVTNDAHLTLFDPENVIDGSSFTEANVPSKGIRHVLVGGQLVVRDGALVEGATPGRAIRAEH